MENKIHSGNQFHYVWARLWRLSLLTLTLVCCSHLHSQNISMESSTLHDQNIFDTYIPTPDQITLFQIDASKDWDFDESSFFLSYNGSLSLFRDLTSRNYHVHVLTLTSLFHFVADDPEEEEDEDDGSNDQDSSEVEEDSSLAIVTPVIQKLPVTIVHSDSGDRFLTFSLTGASQFDKEAFSEFDNSKIAGTVTFRQPLGLLISARPSYSLSYHSYPNLPGLTNSENIFSLLMGTNYLHNGWIAGNVAYGIKGYTASTYTYTVGSSGQAGHGKPGAGGGGGRTKTYTLNTPSVRQFSASVQWEQSLVPDTRLLAQYNFFGWPSSTARILPQQIQSALEQQGAIGTFTSSNDIFDDHYGYLGNGVALQVQQTIPFSINLTIKGDFQKKTYTVPANDLSDTVQVADNRVDRRFEIEINISKTIPFGEGKSVKPRIETHYLRNKSNAPYYDFDKNTFLIGVELNF